MREISSNHITNIVRDLCIDSNYYLPEDIKNKIIQCEREEKWKIGKNILNKIKENIEISKNDGIPLCQDTGMTCVFVEIGQDVHITGGNLEDAINEGVKLGYKQGYLRKSVVSDPLKRINTKDNTPAVIYYNIIPGNNIKITVAPKGFGSENMSKIKMLKPADGLEGVKKFIIDTVIEAGPNPCPPIVVGVGIGGTFEKSAYLAKKALLRSIEIRNEHDFYKDLEEELLREINSTGIGPQGFGGKTTALAVNIETFPTHIAGLPVAVNISCHVTRHKEVII
ncbi:fumarate hydratase [Clostridium niameyense]|uniref:Fumarate hydratase n=1 Tax=Clostridium niameyense TaxID=1622073 RepID=A0A6M0R8S8_9CLOT|nr:fumarate hydratase [Clostridium niameyense]NEZ46655.1 fumarate hydratase [Clostridium niameyense]